MLKHLVRCSSQIRSPGPRRAGSESARWGRSRHVATPRSCDVAKAALEAWTAGVAATVAFLASPHAGHVTGQVIYVSGGACLGR